MLCGLTSKWHGLHLTRTGGFRRSSLFIHLLTMRSGKQLLGILIQLFAVTVVLRLSLSRIFHVFPTHSLTSGPFVRQDVMRLFVPRADTEQCNSEIIIFHDRAYSSENHPGCEYLTKSTRPTFTVTSGSSLLWTHHRDDLDSQTTKKWKLKILNSTAGS